MKKTDGLLTVMVSDMTKSIAFYRDVLGFEVKGQYGGEFAELNAGGLRVGLHPGGKLPLKPHSRHYSIGIQVPDLDAAMKELKKAGVKLGETPTDRGMRLAYFDDPDGNPLYLIEIKWG